MGFSLEEVSLASWIWLDVGYRNRNNGNPLFPKMEVLS
jgi:hypothetical protein